MTIKYPYLEDGTPLKAAELNTRFGPVFDGLNLLHPESVGLGAFRHNHLPCLVGPADYSEDELSVADGFTSRTDLSFNPAEVDCVVITSERATSTGYADANTIISCMTGSDFPSFQVGHQHADEVGAVVLLGNFHIKSWLLADPAKTTSYKDLNEDTLAVQAAFRLHYTTSDGGSNSHILERSQRALSPRLTISKQTLSTAILAEGFRPYGVSSVFAEPSTNSNFNDSSVAASYGVITLRVEPDGGAINIPSVYEDLATYLNDTEDDDDLIFCWDEAAFSGLDGPIEIPTVTIGAREFKSGARVDKAGTLAISSKIKLQAADVDSTAIGSSWNNIDWKTGWVILSQKTAGAPAYLDAETEQDLVMRSVLFSDDLPDRATLNQVSIVATQEGSMVGAGKYKVTTNKANLTVLPLHVKRET